MINTVEKQVLIVKLHQVLILMINMAQSRVLAEKQQADIINMIKMVQRVEAIVKHLPVITNMINMVVRLGVTEQVQTESQPNTTNTEEKQVHSKKILQAELLNMINMEEKLEVTDRLMNFSFYINSCFCRLL